MKPDQLIDDNWTQPLTTNARYSYNIGKSGLVNMDTRSVFFVACDICSQFCSVFYLFLLIKKNIVCVQGKTHYPIL